jgi:hypothetical protein
MQTRSLSKRTAVDLAELPREVNVVRTSFFGAGLFAAYENVEPRVPCNITRHLLDNKSRVENDPNA